MTLYSGNIIKRYRHTLSRLRSDLHFTMCVDRKSVLSIPLLSTRGFVHLTYRWFWSSIRNPVSSSLQRLSNYRRGILQWPGKFEKSSNTHHFRHIKYSFPIVKCLKNILSKTYDTPRNQLYFETGSILLVQLFEKSLILRYRKVFLLRSWVGLEP